MKIIQITDLHIDTPGDETHGVDIRQNFLDVLKIATERQPDLFVLTGDLCQLEANKSVYEWIKNHLDATDIPYEVIAGNHDESSMIATTFNKDNYLTNKELYFSKIISNQKNTIFRLLPKQLARRRK